MTTTYKHIKDVKTSEIILKKDGTIVLNKQGEKKQVIGNWSVSHPKKDAKEKGIGTRGLVDIYYEGGIPYKGRAFGYSRDEFKYCFCRLVSREGVNIVSNE